MIPNSEARQIIIGSLAFNDANSQCKMIIGPLKARLAPLEEYTQDIIITESHDHDGAWIGKVISRGLREGESKCQVFHLWQTRSPKKEL